MNLKEIEAIKEMGYRDALIEVLGEFVKAGRVDDLKAWTIVQGLLSKSVKGE